MQADIRIASLNDRDLWHSIHAASGIPSHGWSFCQAMRFSGISPQLAEVRRGDSCLVIPFFERQWHGETDICTILSVSGATMRPADSLLLDDWAAYATSRGWVAGYLQFEPEAELEGIAGVTAGNPLVLVDIATDDVLAAASTIIRRKIRRAEDVAVTITEDRDALCDAVLRLYPETMARSGARLHYRLDPRTLEAWVRDPGNLVVGAVLASTIGAVAIFPVTGTRAEYHIGATSGGGRSFMAWLLWQAMTKLRQRGVATLNLGGGIKAGDGVQQFKEKFGGRLRPFHVARQIYRSETYRLLCRRAEAPENAVWFPAYRARDAARPVTPAVS